MLRIDEILLRCRLERPMLERWIAHDWVRPLRDDSGWQFSETDVARVELICDLCRDLEIAEDAVEVILPLLDQIYAMRRQVRLLTDALAALPEDVRRDLLARLGPPPET